MARKSCCTCCTAWDVTRGPCSVTVDGRGAVIRQEAASQQTGGGRDAESSWAVEHTPHPLIFVSRGNKGLTGEIVVSRGNKGVRGFWGLVKDLGRSEQAKKRSPDMTRIIASCLLNVKNYLNGILFEWLSWGMVVGIKAGAFDGLTSAVVSVALCAVKRRNSAMVRNQLNLPRARHFACTYSQLQNLLGASEASISPFIPPG